jgi:cyclic peptide transporter
MMFSIIKKNRTRIVLVSAISAVAGAFNIWLLALVGSNARASHFDTWGIAQFAMTLVGMVAISFLSQTLLSRFSARAFYDLRRELVEGISRLSATQLDSIGRHRLYTAFGKDVPSIHELVTVLPNYVFNLTVAVACLVYLCLVSPRLFLVFVAFLVVALVVAKFGIADRGEKRFRERRAIEDELYKCYEAAIDGNKELKLNRDREDIFLNRELKGHAQRYQKVTLSAEFFWNLSHNWSTAGIFLGIGALLLVAQTLSVEDRSAVLTFVMVIFYLIGPLTILMNAFRTVHAGRVGMQRLADLELAGGSPERPHAPTAPFESLSLRHVTFTYAKTEEGGGFTVGPLNFDLHRGELVFFVGGNGSGKTTAAKVLTGLYGRQGGDVLLNGEHVGESESYLQLFSAVFQDYFLFETLVPKRGLPLDPAMVERWMQKLKLTDKVTIEDGRFSTVKLSHGQRKRLALLIACSDDSDIYVFDEWAADQDPEFREFFYRDFLPELKNAGKTLVVVSHDDRYFHLADRVVKFESGKIAEIRSASFDDAQPMELAGT